MGLAAESIRHFLIAEVQAFVTRVRGMPGVGRIDLIGSLTTAKQTPKDADLLVWVDDAADLAPLAAAGRRLKGRAQSRNSGADVFLVNRSGAYLGWICRYRDCRPGIRMSCRALHCGRRPHLCDDLHMLKLGGDVVQAPPVGLWPAAVVHAAVPDDVQRLVSALHESRLCPRWDERPEEI